MRIAFVSRRYWPAVSGMSVYAEQLLGQLVARGHEVVLVSQYRGDPAGTAVYGGGPPPAHRVPAGVEVVALESLGEQEVVHGRPADFEADVEAMVGAVLAAHGRAPLDLVHAQYGYPNGYAALEVGRRAGVPSVVSVQGGDGHWVGSCCTTHREAMEAVLDHAGAVLIGSPTFAEEVVGRLGTARERFTVVGGATTTDHFVPRPGRPLGDLSPVPTLLFHGRVDARKGVLVLLDAVAALVAGGRRVRLVVSGVGPDTGAVARRVVELGLGDVVTETGYCSYEQAPAVYAGADVFVSPTESEGFSNTVLEAMATGLPIVSTAVVGVVDCLRDDENALLVPPRDVAALTAALERVLDDADLRARLAGTALAEVRERWSWPALADRVEAAYARVAGTVPDDGWSAPTGRDPGCRFRAAPHLL